MINVREMNLVNFMGDKLNLVAIDWCGYDWRVSAAYPLLDNEDEFTEHFTAAELTEVINAGILSADGSELCINW